MSPKNAKYNYIFYKPTEKETSLSEYLHYSIEDDIYSENIEENNFKTDDFSQKSTFFNPGGIRNDSFPEKDILIGAEEFIGLEWGYDNEKNDNEERENNFYNFGGNNHSDTENTGEI